ncbi:hypothetical protein GV794_21110 [Nocardia cyriacigeorgica]|uniref:Uncharacterized protein n=1 Tax=Nocardia cyriacigeorgica TaxID=135487 RepID=A0A6P1DBQ0_9NOCA|nr:hypothetical protein [Nocardia cyriacigeorgica]NEW42392.1 hypothetical protein [Nocardia cyriacigeorgica]NEW47001.1 hypothetical protein [Nocardia cyriacigeorgica]NEW53914.1 hypothetical protein [Nocardia cyriacigeorgica]NEW58132.1 hypothetical protein [Nocardia cyriacigeorgica]
MDAAGVTGLDEFGDRPPRKLEFGHVGRWYAPDDDAVLDSGTGPRGERSVAVEIDPGDGSSLVVFVRAPSGHDVSAGFRADDQVCLVVPDAIAELGLPTAPITA